MTVIKSDLEGCTACLTFSDKSRKTPLTFQDEKHFYVISKSHKSYLVYRQQRESLMLNEMQVITKFKVSIILFVLFLINK